MKKLNVLFYKPRTFKGKIIEFFTGAKYSHVGIQLDEYHIFDIIGFSDVKISHNNVNEEYYDRVSITLSDDQYELFHKKINSFKNFEYDYLRALGVKNSDDKYTCYELVQHILYDIGYLSKIKWVVLPEELYNVLIRIEGSRIAKELKKNTNKCKNLFRDVKKEFYEEVNNE